jgi:hypothetical protein
MGIVNEINSFTNEIIKLDNKSNLMFDLKQNFISRKE